MDFLPERDFAKFFKFLELQDQEIALYSGDETIPDDIKEGISKFLSGELQGDEAKQTLFSSLQKDPRLLSELAKSLKQASSDDAAKK